MVLALSQTFLLNFTSFFLLIYANTVDDERVNFRHIGMNIQKLVERVHVDNWRIGRALGVHEFSTQVMILNIYLRRTLRLIFRLEKGRLFLPIGVLLSEVDALNMWVHHLAFQHKRPIQTSLPLLNHELRLLQSLRKLNISAVLIRLGIWVA